MTSSFCLCVGTNGGGTQYEEHERITHRWKIVGISMVFYFFTVEIIKNRDGNPPNVPKDCWAFTNPKSYDLNKKTIQPTSKGLSHLGREPWVQVTVYRSGSSSAACPGSNLRFNYTSYVLVVWLSTVGILYMTTW
ncbi:hypothetical protein BJ741DRAFT_649502 [Chytriomyces cf. hyalinus JEL632]|nr:hypothetical protein BJ741DRAFT_649502 [Chytriomyces cf. hyalinus JEL632]